MKHRMIFISAIRDRITTELREQGVSAETIKESFDLWDSGDEPRTPWERGCFDVFRQVQTNIEG
jgi:hypothetical protein